MIAELGYSFRCYCFGGMFSESVAVDAAGGAGHSETTISVDPEVVVAL